MRTYNVLRGWILRHHDLKGLWSAEESLDIRLKALAAEEAKAKEKGEDGDAEPAGKDPNKVFPHFMLDLNMIVPMFTYIVYFQKM